MGTPENKKEKDLETRIEKKDAKKTSDEKKSAEKKNTDKKSEKEEVNTSKSKAKETKTKSIDEPKRKLSPSAVAGIATLGVLLVIGIVIGIVFLADAIKNDKFFDYVDSNLEKYVTIPETEYKNYDIEIDIAKPRDIDVEVAVLNLIAAKKGEVKNDGAMMTSPVTISAGDKVKIWYRGYLLDDNGEEISVSGMCNFSSGDPAELEIGSGQFVPGFELNLVGKNTGDYPKFTKITEGEIKETQFAYISYKRLVEGGDSKKDTKSGSFVRIDLSDESLDETYGAGFRTQILSAKIGDKLSFGVTLDGKTHNYTETTVNFVTECEVDPLVIKCYFPYDYSNSTLRNETAYFEVYVNGVIQYECPEFTDDFVRELVNEKTSPITEEELNTYEGAALVDKYRTYIKKTLDDAYEEEYESLVEDAMWNHYLEKAEVKKYPKIKVDEIHQEYIDDVYYQFETTGGSIQNQYTQEYEHYEDVDSFAVAYLGLTYSENQDWKAVLYTMSENLVKERLVMYYLMQVEDLFPTEEEFAAELEKVKQEYIDEYVKQYLEHEEKTREDFENDDEYNKFVEERKVELFNYYDEDYFEETTYYEIALREFIKWAKVSTLDDRRAYPQTK